MLGQSPVAGGPLASSTTAPVDNPGAQHYVLSAPGAVYSIAANDAVLTYAHGPKLIGSAAQYTIIPSSAMLMKRRGIAGVTAAYTMSASATLKADRTLKRSAAVYAVAGIPATFTHGPLMYANTAMYAATVSPINVYRNYGAPASDLAYVVQSSKTLAVNRIFVAYHAQYAFEYAEAQIITGPRLEGVAAAYGWSGRQGRLAKNRAILGTLPSYTIRPASSKLAMRRGVLGEGATYTLTVQDGELLLGFLMMVKPGTYQSQASAVLSTQRSVQGQSAAYATVAGPTTAFASRKMQGLFARIYVTAAEVQLARQRASQFAPGSYVVVARLGTLKSMRKLQGEPGREAVRPFAVTGMVTRRLVGLPAQYAAHGFDAALKWRRGVDSAHGSLGVVGAQSGLSVQRRLMSQPMLVEVLAAPAILIYSGASESETGSHTALRAMDDLELVIRGEGTLRDAENLSDR